MVQALVDKARAAADLGCDVVLAADAHTTHAFEGRDWHAVVASQNAALGGPSGVATRLLAGIDVGA